MYSQKIIEIALEDLVLWTENPRDPINPEATDQEIAELALNGNSSKWELKKLAKEMGPFYDFSELPTVVLHDKIPVVYDGNRRIILGKLKHELIEIVFNSNINIPDFPEIIPCNVCPEEVALQNVYRKHADSGSWAPLERDIFLYKFMGEEKSAFLRFDEATGLIRKHDYLNKRFVKEEILTEEILNKLGFRLINESLKSIHSETEALSIITDLVNKIKIKEISTRNNRGKVFEVLDPILQEVVDKNKSEKSKYKNVRYEEEIQETTVIPRLPRRRKRKEHTIFGGKLYIRSGKVADLYRDILDLYDFYKKEKENLSYCFPSLIRMSLRLLAETASSEMNMRLESYLKKYFDQAKTRLNSDTKTTLANQSVNRENITQLLHTGAHNYENSANLEQTIAISFILGEILLITYGQGDN